MEEEKRISEEELKKDVAAAEARIRKTDDFTSPEELYGELIASVKKYHPSDDISLIEKAYRVAADAHKDQKRKSGEPYIIHPLCVAIILADLELDKESIAGMPSARRCRRYRHDRRRADRGVRPGGVPDCKRCHEAGTAEIFCG